MRSHMERVCLGKDELLEASLNAVRKLEKYLVEASIRTPPTVSSRQLIEESLDIVYALRNMLALLRDECGE
ncbi:MAG: hypothetical protein GSR77_02365 [Desulfurococcales archaeon]|nr:hypothetical protein [Desulfurococcales archaeon]